MGKRELLFCWLLIGIHASLQSKLDDISRDDFPPGFIFGAGTSAYQVEGAAAEDGRKPSIWDSFTHAGKMLDGSTGDVAADQYHHYKEDVRLMSKMGLHAYRFSISWSRLIPDGRGPINPKGLKYYNALIDELISHGIEPHITLYHFDLPQSLEDAYGGWLSHRIIDDFRAYAEVCFREFGDRVKYWTTLNEPNAFPTLAYDYGLWPPERCSYPFGISGNCTAGESTVEPYITGHHAILSHAAAVELYRQKFQTKQKGFIGIAIWVLWFVPLTNSTKDIDATQRLIDFFTGWLIEPILCGDYPSIMKETVGSRLPTISKQQSEILKGSFDFIGLNHYSTSYAYDVSDYYWTTDQRDFIMDSGSNYTVFREGIPIGKIGSSPLPIVPWGMQAVLEYFKQHYNNPLIIIYENGYCMSNNESLLLADALNDRPRMEYLHDYIESLLAAVRNGSNTRGYFVWTLLDSFELFSGYQTPFGLYYVDYKDRNRTRYTTRSAEWYTHFLKGKARKHKHIIMMWKRQDVPTNADRLATVD